MSKWIQQYKKIIIEYGQTKLIPVLQDLFDIQKSIHHISGPKKKNRMIITDAGKEFDKTQIPFINSLSILYINNLSDI